MEATKSYLMSSNYINGEYKKSLHGLINRVRIFIRLEDNIIPQVQELSLRCHLYDR